MVRIFHHTLAMCPVCRLQVNARVVERGDGVYLEKFCEMHGFSQALISSDAEWYRRGLLYVKPKQAPLHVQVKEFRGCPESCGSCPEHQQHTCLPVIEITSACNLACPVCLKRFAGDFQLSFDDFARILDTLIRCEGTLPVINLSGGEPTLHPRLAEFLHLARDKGVMQITVSTNGLLLLERPELRELFRRTGTLVALQFDGFRAETWVRLRGRDLSAKKQELIEILEQENIRYSLVATLAKGINDDEIAPVAEFFFRSRAVSLMFQPLCRTGSGATFPVSGKLTIPDVVHALEKCPPMHQGDFNPLPCSHASCFALAYYCILGEGRFVSLKEFLGSENYLRVIANRTLPGLDPESFDLIRQRLYDVWSLADAGSLGEQILQRIRQVLREVGGEEYSRDKTFALGVETMKAIFIHDFMDLDTFDFGRLLKCCNPYPQADGRLIPMCAQNVCFQGSNHG